MSMSEGHVRHLINTMSENGRGICSLLDGKGYGHFWGNVLEEF